jgi:hypothetical protein
MGSMNLKLERQAKIQNLRALYDAMSNGGAEDDADGEIGESVIDKVSDYLERKQGTSPLLLQREKHAHMYE